MKQLSPWIIALSIALAGCSDSDNDNIAAAIPPDFTEADALLEDFVATNEFFSGASMVIVDQKEGILHQSAVGDHTLDTVVLLASTSKMPAASLLMALAEDDDNVNFEIDAAIDQYLPYTGVWTGRTAEQLVSNTSGIPGLGQVGGYGAHICQYIPVGQLQDCGRTIYQTDLPALISTEPGTAFDYGGSQWQLAGAVAELVGGASWAQLFDQYIGEPCDLEVFRFGNMVGQPLNWDGTVEGLAGAANPNIEGGAISNLDDYAKILLMHLNDGACGDNQVISQAATEFMRIDRKTPLNDNGWGYGMGWWVIPAVEGGEIYLYIDPGAFGSVSWIDIDRQIGGYVALEEYGFANAGEGSGMVINQLIPLIEEAIDAVR